ncbi:hypothetical protein PAECIP111891_02520 [Paenibacillus allorhizoplanae]|uniref:Uncharacterized protein n=1 Tax=Paenibacillus allorhizoplanae TaxID=2905648 RepID=A0ABN8GE30_9BACL|nr:hypothetical protein [Paenibacillus allorhizoplanae]CAH1204498.1 hypothetical protein PAECIP111891_02520 [Paenibacillus allorhizoplanae]
MESKIGLMMDLPDGKIPGFYAQIVKALAGKVELFDRDKEMLIVSNEEQQRAALDVMAHFNIETSIMELRLLAEEAGLTDLFSDYGFTSRAEHNYLYDKIVIPFRFTANSPAAEVDQAVLQVEEHLIAQYKEGDHDVYVVDRQLEELMHGIAKAYRCSIEILR